MTHSASPRSRRPVLIGHDPARSRTLGHLTCPASAQLYSSDLVLLRAWIARLRGLPGGGGDRVDRGTSVLSGRPDHGHGAPASFVSAAWRRRGRFRTSPRCLPPGNGVGQSGKSVTWARPALSVAGAACIQRHPHQPGSAPWAAARRLLRSSLRHRTDDPLPEVGRRGARAHRGR